MLTQTNTASLGEVTSRPQGCEIGAARPGAANGQQRPTPLVEHEDHEGEEWVADTGGMKSSEGIREVVISCKVKQLLQLRD